MWNTSCWESTAYLKQASKWSDCRAQLTSYTTAASSQACRRLQMSRLLSAHTKTSSSWILGTDRWLCCLKWWPWADPLRKKVGGHETSKRRRLDHSGSLPRFDHSMNVWSEVKRPPLGRRVSSPVFTFMMSPAQHVLRPKERLILAIC